MYNKNNKRSNITNTILKKIVRKKKKNAVTKFLWGCLVTCCKKSHFCPPSDCCRMRHFIVLFFNFITSTGSVQSEFRSGHGNQENMVNKKSDGSLFGADSVRHLVVSSGIHLLYSLVTMARDCQVFLTGEKKWRFSEG